MDMYITIKQSVVEKQQQKYSFTLQLNYFLLNALLSPLVYWVSSQNIVTSLIYLINCSLLHSIIGRSATTLRYNPIDVLRHILDITCLAMYTILGVDL